MYEIKIIFAFNKRVDGPDFISFYFAAYRNENNHW